MLQQLVHYSLHLMLPGLIAWVFFRQHWKRAWLIMLATMLVDVDHLLAEPVFSLNRCSINFHPLHTYVAIVAYSVLFFFKKTRIIALGLLLHMLTDGIDCWWMR